MKEEKRADEEGKAHTLVNDKVQGLKMLLANTRDPRNPRTKPKDEKEAEESSGSWKHVKERIKAKPKSKQKEAPEKAEEAQEEWPSLLSIGKGGKMDWAFFAIMPQEDREKHLQKLSVEKRKAFLGEAKMPPYVFADYLSELPMEEMCGWLNEMSPEERMEMLLLILRLIGPVQMKILLGQGKKKVKTLKPLAIWTLILTLTLIGRRGLSGFAFT